MNKKEYLSEENYQKNKNKINLVAIIVLIVGLCIGGSLITIGIINKNQVDTEYSEENKQNEILRIEAEIETEKTILNTKKKELEDKGIEYDSFTEYDDGESYDLMIISKALDPGSSRCVFDEYKNNSITKKYCSLKSELEEVQRMNVEFERKFNSSRSTPLFMFGAFIIIATLMIAGSIYMFTKRREIAAFSVQQIMPVAQEGLEKMAPTIGKAGKTIAKEMAPVYGEMAKEISKGIKDGFKDNSQDEEK